MFDRPQPASIRSRITAGTIDGALGAALLAVLGWLSPIGAKPAGEREQRTRSFWADPRTVRAVDLGTPVGTVLLHRVQSPGSRIVGIRRADARTGGPQSLRSALVRGGLEAALRLGLSRVNRHPRERLQHSGEVMRARMDAVREEFADDPAARERVGAEIGRQGMRGCATAMLPMFALSCVEPLSALLSPRPADDD